MAERERERERERQRTPGNSVVVKMSKHNSRMLYSSVVLRLRTFLFSFSSKNKILHPKEVLQVTTFKGDIILIT